MHEKLAENEKNTHIDGEEEELHESQILEEFDHLYNMDPKLKHMLGEFPERYSLEEKCSIVQAYKKGGGVEGLAEIIDDEESDEQGASPPKNPHHEDDDEEVDIDLDNPNDVKVIENEF